MYRASRVTAPLLALLLLLCSAQCVVACANACGPNDLPPCHQHQHHQSQRGHVPCAPSMTLMETKAESVQPMSFDGMMLTPFAMDAGTIVISVVVLPPPLEAIPPHLDNSVLRI